MKEKALKKKLVLPRRASLKSKKQIDLLFRKGYAHKAYPFVVKYFPKTDDDLTAHQFIFSVPKKNFKRAVDRNLLKRRIREAYRRNQFVFSVHEGNPYLNIAFLYIGKKILSYQSIERAMITALEHLSQKNEKKK